MSLDITAFFHACAFRLFCTASSNRDSMQLAASRIHRICIAGNIRIAAQTRLLYSDDYPLRHE